MKLIDALYKRKSVKHYLNDEIESDILGRIKERIIGMEHFYESGEIRIVFLDYCKRPGMAPYYIGVYTDGTREGKINAGFVLQQESVYLAAIGISSCFQVKSPIFNPVNEEGMELMISMAFGYAQDKKYREKSEINRLPLKKTCVIKEKMNKEIEKIIEFARIAPSSYNVQPWRFVVYKDRIHIFAKKGMTRPVEKFIYVNIGVMLANIVIGADELWIDIVIKEVKGIKEKYYGKNEYIVSIYDKNHDEKILDL